MKQKFKYVVVGLVCIMIGVSGTIVTYHYYPQETVVKTIKDVDIHETNTIKSAIDKIYDAVVVVQEYDNKGNMVGTGTGFVYKKDDEQGYILTNHHVINGASSIRIITSQEKEIEAKVLGSDEYSDIAVLSINAAEVLQVATIGDSTALELGDTLFTVGSPLGSKYIGTVTKGILSGKDRKVTVSLKTGSFIMDVLQTDAAINPGNSGGPLLNINGEVVGITSLKLVQDEIEGMGFAIPIELAMTSIDKLEKGEAIVRPVLGIQLASIDNPYLFKNYQITIPNGVKTGIVIISVERNSAAFHAGLKKGDIMTKIGDYDINDSSHFKYILYQYNVGDDISVVIIRDGKEQTVQVKLTDSLGQ